MGRPKPGAVARFGHLLSATAVRGLDCAWGKYTLGSAAASPRAVVGSFRQDGTLLVSLIQIQNRTSCTSYQISYINFLIFKPVIFGLGRLFEEALITDFMPFSLHNSVIGGPDKQRLHFANTLQAAV